MPSRPEERRWGRLKPLRHGELLRAARARAGYSPKQVSELTQISTSQLSDLERGISTLSLARARQLAATYGVDARPFIEAILQDRLEAAGFEGFRIIVSVSSR